MTSKELLKLILKMIKTDKDKIKENPYKYIEKIKSLIERGLKNG